MKRMLSVAIVSAIATLPFTSNAFASIILNMNSQLPETAASSEVTKWFADEVSRRTDGEVQIKVFFGETLGRASESLSLMRNGGLDMAMFSPGYYASEMPFTALPNSVPMALSTVEQSKDLMVRLLEEVPEFRAEHQRNGVRALFFHNVNPNVLISKTPIVNIDDMAGKRVRTWGADMPQLVSAVGGVPINMGMSDIYESLSNNAIDAAPWPVDYMETYKLYEVAKHVSTVPLFVGITGGVWISDSAWDRLNNDQQQVFLDISSEARERDYDVVTKAAETARESLVQYGVTFHEFPLDEQQKWKSALPDFFASWVEQMEAVGKGDDARKTIEIWKEVVAE